MNEVHRLEEGVSAVVVDPADGMHAFAAFGAFSRRRIDLPGVGEGHVFETVDGGETRADITENLPDAHTRDLVLSSGGDLDLATDVGVFTADADTTTWDAEPWSQLGTNLPHAVVDDLSFLPDGTTILAATHGRGLWSFAAG